MEYKLTGCERETVTNWDEETKEARIYTCSKVYMKRLDKLCEKFPEEYKLECEDEYSKTYWAKNKKYLYARSPGTKRELTEEQKQALKERVAKMHEARRKS